MTVYARSEECVLCGHDHEAHDWRRHVPNKHTPCPECPDRLCRDPEPWYELRLLFRPEAGPPAAIDPLRLADSLAPVLGAGLLDAVTVTAVTRPMPSAARALPCSRLHVVPDGERCAEHDFGG